MNEIKFKKEYAILNKDSKNVHSIVEEKMRKDNILILNSYQKFITNFININTDYNRLLLNHSTGSGKTISSLSVATEFIEYLKKNDIKDGNVFIIGFNKKIFKQELILKSEFNIITKDELKEYIELLNSDKHNKFILLKELNIKYTRRMTSRKLGGRYKFIGYKELFMRLFNVHNLNLEKMNESEIFDNIEKGFISIDKNLLYSFNNSLIIADEIHNVYNSFENNNWGIALQYILDYYDKNNLYLKTLFLSATPINHKPIEIISITNLLLPYKDKIIDRKIEITDTFLNKIKKLLKFKISFIKDYDPKNYPLYKFKGEKIPGIDYLKFIECPMSKYHYNTYKNLSDMQKNKIEKFDTTEFIESEEIRKSLKEYPINLSMNNRYLMDYALPNPENDNIGLYTQDDIKNKIFEASHDWKEKNKINAYENKTYGYYTTGNFMLLKNLEKYSSKYHKLLLTIKDIVLNDAGKIFVYHNYVNNSGISFIAEILKINGFLDEYGSPVSNTICVNCYKTLKDHKDKDEFMPIRFIYISGDIAPNIVIESLRKFNSLSNIDGKEYKIILGAKALKEGITLKHVQHLFVTNVPINISTLIQILGRSIRKFSHNGLPENQKKVDIYLFVSSIPRDNKRIFSFEEYNYKNKIETYKEIEYINKHVFIKNSVDFFINNKVNKYKLKNINDDLLNNSLLISNNDKKLLDKYNNKMLNINNIDDTVYKIFYNHEEINKIKILIKRCFLELSPYWKHEDLYEQIINFPFNLNFEPKLFSKDSFIIAIQQLLYYPSNVIIKNTSESNDFNDRLLNPMNKIFYSLDGTENVIVYNNEFYIMIKYDNNQIYYNIGNHSEKKYDIYISLDDIVPDITNKYEDIENKILEIKEFNIKDNLFYDYDLDFHIYLLEKIISLSFKKMEIPKKYMNILDYYKKLNITIMNSNINKLLSSMYKNHNNIIPIGHKLKKRAYFYSPETKTWILFNNYKDEIVSYKNNFIYGEINYIKKEYKLILHYDNKDISNKDKRHMKTGIVCKSITKNKLNDIMVLLKIDNVLKKKGEMCKIILNKLIELEHNKTDTTIKYFYNVWE